MTVNSLTTERRSTSAKSVSTMDPYRSNDFAPVRNATRRLRTVSAANAENAGVDVGRRLLDEVRGRRDALGRLAGIVRLVVGTRTIRRIFGIPRVWMPRIGAEPRPKPLPSDEVHAGYGVQDQRHT